MNCLHCGKRILDQEIARYLASKGGRSKSPAKLAALKRSSARGVEVNKLKRAYHLARDEYDRTMLLLSAARIDCEFGRISQLELADIGRQHEAASEAFEAAHLAYTPK